MNWWEIDNADFMNLSPDKQAQVLEERRRAYFHTFYSSEHGKQVLLDIQRICYNPKRGNWNTFTQDGAIGALALVEFYQDLRRSCGISEQDEMLVVSAEAQIAGTKEGD